jgi:hypothetical protein
LKEWKYKVVVLERDLRSEAKTLTSYGALGWELVAVHQACDNKRVAYFKMPEEEVTVQVVL